MGPVSIALVGRVLMGQGCGVVTLGQARSGQISVNRVTPLSWVGSFSWKDEIFYVTLGTVISGT